MAAKSRFVDDMHPRSFPNAKKQLMLPRKVPPPKPILSGASMIFDKNELTKAAPKNSFSKWKRQHEALFERKEFRTTNETSAFVRKGNVIAAHQSTASVAKFELDFKSIGASQQGDTDDFEPSDHGNRFKNDSPPKLKRPQFQSMMAFSQLNRVARSEVKSFNVPPVGQHYSNPIEDDRLPSCGCRCVVVASSPIPNTDSDDYQGTQVLENEVVDSTAEKAVELKRPLTSKVLANVVEEQIEIVEQQKQILQQQNEIFNLQYRIEKFMLTNGSGLKNLLPPKQLQSITAAPTVQPTVLPIVNGSECLHRSPKGRQSIGVMTDCQGYSPVTAVENGSPKDTMLERINKIIENSPPMINYKQTNGIQNCRISPHRADINISSQTLIYKASTRNNISVNDPKVADRSFALHLLDMKYHPETATTTTSSPTNRLSPRHNLLEMAKRSSPKSTENDFVPLNISPDKYDYLIRHGLLKK